MMYVCVIAFSGKRSCCDLSFNNLTLQTRLHIHNTDFHLLVVFLLLLHSFTSIKNELLPSHPLEVSEKNVSNLNYNRKSDSKTHHQYVIAYVNCYYFFRIQYKTSTKKKLLCCWKK